MWIKVHLEENLWAMSTFDWCTLVLALIFIALASVGEKKDTQFCLTMIKRRAENAGAVWVVGLKLIGGLRRWTFVPGMLVAVVNLVAIQGGVRSFCIIASV